MRRFMYVCRGSVTIQKLKYITFQQSVIGEGTNKLTSIKSKEVQLQEYLTVASRILDSPFCSISDVIVAGRHFSDDS